MSRPTMTEVSMYCRDPVLAHCCTVSARAHTWDSQPCYRKKTFLWKMLHGRHHIIGNTGRNDGHYVLLLLFLALLFVGIDFVVDTAAGNSCNMVPLGWRYGPLVWEQSAVSATIWKNVGLNPCISSSQDFIWKHRVYVWLHLVLLFVVRPEYKGRVYNGTYIFAIMIVPYKICI